MQIARLLLILTVGSFAIAGCDRDEGPAEETREAMDSTGERIEDAAEDAGNAMEDACEEMKEGVDAEDTDC